MRRPHCTNLARLLGVLVAAAGLLAAPVGARAQEHEAGQPEAHDAHGPMGESSEHGEHPKNALALFLGGRWRPPRTRPSSPSVGSTSGASLTAGEFSSSSSM